MASCRVVNFLPYRLAVFNRPQKLSVGALWQNPKSAQQFPFLLIDERMSQPFRAFWNSWLQYWLPGRYGISTLRLVDDESAPWSRHP